MSPARPHVRHAALAVVVVLAGAFSCQQFVNLNVDGITWRNAQLTPVSLSHGQLVPSDDVWTGGDESVTLAWEAVVSGRRDNGSHVRVAMCTGLDADTGADLGFAGLPLATNAAVDRQHALQACDPSSLACRPADPPCAAPGSDLYPFCATQCTMTPGSDTLYRVAIPPFPASPLFPAVRPVAPQRAVTLFAPFDASVGAPLFTPSMGHMPINYSPRLSVARIRAPAGYAGYAPIGELRLPGGIVCHHDADDDTMISAAEGCPQMRSFVPAYAKAPDGSPGDPAAWRVTLLQGGANGTPIEFLIADPVSKDWHVNYAGPNPIDFRVVLPDRITRLSGVFAIGAPPNAGFTLQGISVSGAQAQEFTAAVHGSHAPHVPPYGSFSVDVTVDPTNTRQSELQAAIRIALVSDGGQAQEIDVPLHASVLAAGLSVAPQSLAFTPAAFAGQSLPWSRRVAISNDIGPLAARISELSLSDTANFWLTNESGTGSASLSTLRPGEGEVISVMFCGAGPLPSDALLGVTASYDDGMGGPPYLVDTFVRLHADPTGMPVPLACQPLPRPPPRPPRRPGL